VHGRLRLPVVHAIARPGVHAHGTEGRLQDGNVLSDHAWLYVSPERKGEGESDHRPTVDLDQWLTRPRLRAVLERYRRHHALRRQRARLRRRGELSREGVSLADHLLCHDRR
jgi:hypothetical protein